MNIWCLGMCGDYWLTVEFEKGQGSGLCACLRDMTLDGHKYYRAVKEEPGKGSSEYDCYIFEEFYDDVVAVMNGKESKRWMAYRTIKIENDTLTFFSEAPYGKKVIFWDNPVYGSITAEDPCIRSEMKILDMVSNSAQLIIVRWELYEDRGAKPVFLRYGLDSQSLRAFLFPAK